MISQRNSENIDFAGDANHPFSLNSLLLTYGSKSVELQVTKDAVNTYQDSIAEKETILKTEEQTLEELNYQVWSLEDSICDQVWRFSYEHDFSVIFQQYPFVVENGCVKQNDTNNKDVERSSELIDLINEIDNLKAEICTLNSKKNVKQAIENALTSLRELQAISDNVTELLKLIDPLESSRKLAISMPFYNEIILTDKKKVRRRKTNSVCEDAKNKKPCNNRQQELSKTESCSKNNKLNITPNEVIITTPKNYPQLSLEKSVIFTERTAITNVSEVSAEYTSGEKLKTFTLKKRSQISIRFEQHKYKNY